MGKRDMATPALNRRDCLAYLAALGLAAPAQALSGLAEAKTSARLDAEQSRLFRLWFAAIVRQQVAQGPSARWQHRDCAGLVRFAVFETLRSHDAAWRRASGFHSQNLPPEIHLSAAQQALRNQWQVSDGGSSAYVSAVDLIGRNSVALGKSRQVAQSGDLLFFDQGDHQHVMVWLGEWIVYHTGTTSSNDNGLRAVKPQDILKWADTRWRIIPNNPNFRGFYRLALLSR